MELHFEPGVKRVAVKLSGGADSAIVYYAVCDYYKDMPDVEIYTLTLDTKLKWWYSHGANNIIEKVGEMTGKYPTERIVLNYDKYDSPTVGHEYENGIKILTNDAVSKYNIEVSYSGLTLNPPVDEFKQFFVDNNHKFELDLERVNYSIDIKRDKTRDTAHPEYSKIIMRGAAVDKAGGFTGPNFIGVRPFMQSDKRAVSDLYHQYGVFEDLYPLTFSCEDFPRFSHDDLVHCKYCFFCLERYYGFGRIV
jgi:hypothetical protein